MRRMAFGVLAAWLIGCGGAVDPFQDGGGEDASKQDSGGPFSCGDTTCSGDSVCIHPCCGGAPPPCFPKDDAGACPSGTVPGCLYQNQSDMCTYPPCTPPPPYCAPASSTTGMCIPQSGGHDCYEACA